MLMVNGRTRPVSCTWYYCKHRRAMVLVRDDTRAVVGQREALGHERQPDMFAVFDVVEEVTPGPTLGLDARIEMQLRKRPQLLEVDDARLD